MNALMSPLFYPCDKIPDLAYDYLEHRLPTLVALRFHSHLSLCKGCAEFVRLYRMAADPLQFLQETPPPSDLVEVTLKFLDREFGLTDQEHP